jgi:microcystin-dependent protein
LSIAQNTALFALLGTTYGGNGTTNFALPNLQDAAPLGFGQGAGLSDRVLGETGGETSVTLTSNQLPAHNHAVAVNTSSGGSNSPANHVFGASQARAISSGYQTSAPSVAMSDQGVGVSGGSQPHNNMPPYLGLNFCIALQGIFPSHP